MKRQFYSDDMIHDITVSLKKKLDPKRFIHSLGVSQTAVSLAMCYGEDLEFAQMAGLLHDCAKCMKYDKMLEEAKAANLPMSKIQEENPVLLHGALGSYYAEKLYHIKEEPVLNAIYYHTLGRPNMSMLEKIVHVADYIEPNREKLKDLNKLRQLAFHEIDQAVYEMALISVDDLTRRNKAIDTQVYEIIESYKRRT